MALDEKLKKLRGDYAIAMIDIDKFKNFNDTYGHDSGDVVLQVVAELIESESSGYAYRFGGEEFTLVYPHRLAPEVEEELENLRETIANTRVGVTRKTKRAKKLLKKKVTVSIGLADSAGKYNTALEVLNAADNALFKAKDEGRNRLCIK
jgi:diguanylate cyclase (GGDEF)-like protein